MRLAVLMLGLRLSLGTAVACFSMAYVHMGAMGVTCSYNIRLEFDQIRQTAKYLEPLAIRSCAFARNIDSWETGFAEIRHGENTL